MGANGSGSEASAGPWTTGEHTLIYNDANGSVVLDGDYIAENCDFGASSQLVIGYRSGSGPLLSGKIYYFKITDKTTGNIVRNYIPCYRKSDGVIGFYDSTTQTFYTNNGSGTFGKGDDVEGDCVTVESTLINNQNHTLYAQWEPKVQVIFDANGGNVLENEELVNSVTKYYDKDTTYGELPIPTRYGYTFKGWVRKILPIEYQQVEYIQFSGAQYINTGLVPSNRN